MKTILACVMLMVIGMHANSQCDKKVSWYGTKGDMLDATGALLDTKTDSVFIETGPQNLSVKFKADPQGLEGTITGKTCEWKEPFKNGKTVYHAAVSVDGRDSNATLTLEAKDGKITLSVTVDAFEGRKFLIYIDGYREGK